MTPAQARQQVAAVHASWARTANRTARTEAARQAADRRIADEFGIPSDLAADEWGRRMVSARSAYFRRLAAKSVRVRAAKREAGAA